MCIVILPECKSVNQRHSWSLRKQKEVVRSPETVVTDSCAGIDPSCSGREETSLNSLTISLAQHYTNFKDG